MITERYGVAIKKDLHCFMSKVVFTATIWPEVTQLIQLDSIDFVGYSTKCFKAN